jgi:hypothetical protein
VAEEHAPEKHSMRWNGYTFREATVSDLSAIAELFSRHDYGPKKIEWLQWKYLDNPDGPACVFIAETAEGDIASLVSFMPRQFIGPDGKPFLALQSADVFTAREYRGKGIYSKLERFSREGIDLPKFGFPNDMSIGFGFKGGWHVLGRVKRWVFPVSAEPRVHWGFAFLIDRLLKLYTLLWLGRCPKDLQMKPVKRFDKGFNIDMTAIHGARSLEYLNWRFIDCPMHSYSVYEFLEGNTSVGYCVYVANESSAELLEMFSSSHYRSCLRLLVERCRDERISRLRVWGLGPVRLGRFGFIRRRSSAFCTAMHVPQTPWMLTFGDSDF